MSRAKSKGQALPLVAILLAAGVLIGFLAIAIDGGSALLQRRTMQNGADAAVLAAVNLMSDNTFQSCVPAPCHPSYGLTNGNVFAQITALTGNNRGGAVGAGPGNYGVSFAYHFISGAPTSPFTVDPYGYGPIVTDMNDLVPDFADGVAVTNTIKNPTIFVRALPSSVVGTQLTEMAISARAAGRIYATCPPAPQPGRTLPFTRFYPAIQWEIDQAGNDPLNPFPLWQSNQDISNDGSLKNMVSLAQASHWGGQQLITQFDTRDGTTGPFSPNEAGQMLEYGANAPGDPYVDCSILSPCAKMYGSASGNQDSTDISNYVFWRWRGLVSVNSTWPSQPGRLGDWAETYHIGDAGNNIHQPLIDLFTYVPPSAPGAPAPGPLSGPPLNLGPAITMTIFMWGKPWDNYPNRYSDDGSYAQWHNDCSHTGQWRCQNPPYPEWDDLQITGGLQGQGVDFNIPNGPIELDRVRFTKYFTMVFYQAIIAGDSSSEVKGFILSPHSPGPNPGSCSWAPGNGVYTGQVNYP